MQQPTFSLLLLVAIAGCSDLTAVPTGTCGNLVVEASEQCDGEASCGSEGIAACRFTCDRGTTSCPGSLACAVDGYCVATTGAFVPFEQAPRYEMPADRIVVGDLDGDGRDDVIGVGDSLRVRFGAPDAPLATSYEKRIRPPTGPAAIGQLDGELGLDVVFPTADGIFTLVSRGRELDAVPYASTQSLPSDLARACTPSPGWETCRTIDLNRDGRLDRVGFVRDRDNLEIELGRAVGSVPISIDTVDIITDVTTGDFDGDAFGDIAYITRSANGLASDGVHVLYGAPQPETFAATLLLSAVGITGLAAADLDATPDGIDDLAVERSLGGASGVVVYLGDSARDLSAPFRLDSGTRAELDVPYALVAGEFVGGVGSGIDVMAYARNPADSGRAYLWWLRGLGRAQLTVGAVDPVETIERSLLDRQWQVGDLVADISATANGPDEVIGLSSSSAGCSGPALSVAVPSARFTTTDLLRSACLQLEGSGWAPALLGLIQETGSRRAVALANRGSTWWIGEAGRLDDSTASGQLSGTAFELQGSCRDAQLWQQTPSAGTFVSWICDSASSTTVIQVRWNDDAAPSPTAIAEISRGASHVVGDFNGDGLTDLAIRQGREIAIQLQCSTDMVGTPGC